MIDTDQKNTETDTENIRSRDNHHRHRRMRNGHRRQPHRHPNDHDIEGMIITDFVNSAWEANTMDTASTITSLETGTVQETAI